MASLNLPAVAGRVLPSHLDGLEPHIPISIPQAETLVEQIQDQTQDQICRALALECDRLDLILRYISAKKVFKTAEAIATIGRRVAALKLLGARLDHIHEKEEASLEISVMARVVRLTKDVLRESGLPAETRETLFQSLVEKISATSDNNRK